MTSALEGIRVVEFGQYIAAPLLGMLLADQGAEVIKVERPSGDPMRRHPAFQVWNRGKRSVVLDLKTAAGKEVFFDLARTADVIVENFKKGVVERLGIDYESVRRVKPDIVYGTFNAYGREGPLAHVGGFDPQAQSMTGIMMRNSGRNGEVPFEGPFAYNDYATGITAAYGIILALMEWERTGRGQYVHTALAYTASTLQSSLLIDYPGFQRRELEGPNVQGWSALDRLYRAEDGWLALVVADEDEWQGLVTMGEFASLAVDPRFSTEEARQENDASLAESLGEIFVHLPVGTWLGRLTVAGVPATRSATLYDFYDDPAIRDEGLVVTRPHDWLGPVDHTGLGVRLSKTPQRLGNPAPLVGEHTVKTLTELLGYSGDRVEALLAERVVETGARPV